MDYNEETLWNAMIVNQKRCYRTVKNLPFTFCISGNEMLVSRRDKSITRATVNTAYARVKALTEAGERVDGPKKLGCFGDSYIYPVFRVLGVIPK